MKTVFFVLAAVVLLLSVSGCQCGCLSRSASPDRDLTAAYREKQNPSVPTVTMEMDFQAEYVKSF
jgi:hypothetical protein